MDEFYFYDGREAVGPHSLRELQEMFAMAVINSQTPVIRTGEKDWATLARYCDVNAPECQPLELGDDYYSQFTEAIRQVETQQSDDADATQALPSEPLAPAQIEAIEEQQESIREEEERYYQQRATQHQLLRRIRAELDVLWEAQREAIISRIRFEPLDKKYEATRRKNREIYKTIEDDAIEFWRRSGILTACIRDLTWREHDFTVRLRGKTESDKYAFLQGWLEENRMAGLSGCYCFKNGRDYLYIGQAGILRDRLKQHEKKTYFTYATSVRIVIPKYSRRLNQLERLLILAHQPQENGNGGVAGRTPVDECLEFIKGEIKELVTDF